jgi:hypothetical protein
VQPAVETGQESETRLKVETLGAMASIQFETLHIPSGILCVLDVTISINFTTLICISKLTIAQTCEGQGYEVAGQVTYKSRQLGGVFFCNDFQKTGDEKCQPPSFSGKLAGTVVPSFTASSQVRTESLTWISSMLGFF